VFLQQGLEYLITESLFRASSERVHKLRWSRRHIRKPGSIMVSWSRKPEEQTTVTPIDPNTSPSNEVTNVAVADASEYTSATAAHAPKSSEQEAAHVFTEVELAKATAGRLGKDYDGTVIENVATVSSSDLCGTILGYVDKIVQLGDILSQVVTPDTCFVDGFT
jgi:hypothetical protein